LKILVHIICRVTQGLVPVKATLSMKPILSTTDHGPR
jgi:hypothetical protein